jgi:hypothetical protein
MVCYHVVTSMGPRNAYKDMLNNVVSPIVGGIRNQAFRTPNREIISVSQPQFERLNCETSGAFKSVFISQNLSFDQYPSSSAE